MSRRRVRYSAEIVGDAEPFKWQVKQTGDYGTANVSECKGESETFTDAIFDAAECARRAEAKRRHASTVRTEDLFEVEPEPDADDDDER